ncbi:zinc-binding dehydrogenase [Domibacillus epiphyticus]|uniref:Alcohol dehydrogenase n=1 Tax=Domibacillus epiphyticus TaxID=1714355 RepID=A0A1V2AAS5_9BACI|nr:zinc-binding dehydrogenase [Domibacillus epiphyticus]OMP68050.1 alcohol dehydrogenase [Domibacillus epiphyticus]
MKGILLSETGGPDNVQYMNVEQPIPGIGDVVVRLKNASLNRRDVFITYGMYPGMNLPSILGADGAGVVYSVGDNVESLMVGDEVVINPGINWGPDINYNAPDFHVLGMPADGTFAEFIKVPSENVYRKPAYLSWMETAAIPLSALTAYRAVITRGDVKSGTVVFIPGIGSGVALFALQIAIARRARVFVSSSSDEKIARAKRMGAEGGVNYRSESWVKTLKEEMGSADVIIDGIGGETFKDLIHLAKPGGKIINFGATAGPVPELVLPRVFFKHLDIRGTTMGSPQEFADMLQLFEQHEIRPVIDKQFPLADAASALKYMEEGSVFGKIVLDIS